MRASARGSRSCARTRGSAIRCTRRSRRASRRPTRRGARRRSRSCCARSRRRARSLPSCSSCTCTSATASAIPARRASGGVPHAGARSLAAILDAGVPPAQLCVELLDYDFALIEPVIAELGLSVALDVGHLERDGHDVLAWLDAAAAADRGDPVARHRAGRPRSPFAAPLSRGEGAGVARSAARARLSRRAHARGLRRRRSARVARARPRLACAPRRARRAPGGARAMNATPALASSQRGAVRAAPRAAAARRALPVAAAGRELGDRQRRHRERARPSRGSRCATPTCRGIAIHGRTSRSSSRAQGCAMPSGC